MTYPSSDVSTTDMDAGTDVPATARSSILDLAQKFNLLRNFITTIGQAIISAGNAGAARTAIGAAASGPLAASGITGAAASGNNADITSWSGGPLAGFRNRIINGNFGVNQRAYVSGAAVGAGLYGHDRWKMAASGDTYTFSTTANVTTVTIPAGKVLQQVIEGLNLETGTYTLSWVGTAQGKIGAGSYGASGITGAITGGTNTTIEFGPGTVSKVQLEFGSVATAFESNRPYGMELMLCQRYAFAILANSQYVGHVIDTGNAIILISCPCEMRAAPSVPSFASNGVLVSANGASFPAVSTAYMLNSSRRTIQITINTGSGLAGAGTVTRWQPASNLMATAEL